MKVCPGFTVLTGQFIGCEDQGRLLGRGNVSVDSLDLLNLNFFAFRKMEIKALLHRLVMHI